MKKIRTVTVGNAEAVLFSNGDVIYAGQYYFSGLGCNESVLKALKI